MTGHHGSSCVHPLRAFSLAAKRCLAGALLVLCGLAPPAAAQDETAQQNMEQEEGTPVTHFSATRATQSDHLDMETGSLSQEFKFDNNSADYIGPFFEYNRFDQKDVGDANLYRPGINGHYDFNRWTGFTGAASVDQIDASGGQGHTIPTYSGYVNLSPNEKWSFDVGSSRNTFTNLPSLFSGIAATYFGGDVNYLPTETWRLTVRGNEGLYSDGNERQLVQLETEKQIWDKPFISIGARGTGIHFLHEFNNGYFDAEHYYDTEALLRLKTKFTDRLSGEISASVGAEEESPGYSPRLTYDPSAKISYKLAKNLTLDGVAEYYESHLASDSGFAQLILGVALHYTWE